VPRALLCNERVKGSTRRARKKSIVCAVCALSHQAKLILIKSRLQRNKQLPGAHQRTATSLFRFLFSTLKCNSSTHASCSTKKTPRKLRSLGCTLWRHQSTRAFFLSLLLARCQFEVDLDKLRSDWAANFLQ
jgi:hypothetical protein